MGALIRSWLLAACALGAAMPASAVEAVVFPGADGKLQLKGHWFRAAGAEPKPAVIALHGCGGLANAAGQLQPVWRRQAAYFNAEQMHVLVPDSFGPRGEGSLCSTPNNGRSVHEEDRRGDVFAAMHWLAQQPGVDATRIVVAGWSHGAQAVLSVLDATDKAVQSQTLRPRAAVAFYPGCRKFLRMLDYKLAAPLLVMIGELDDWTPAPPCVDLARKFAAPDQPVFELAVYSGSYHGFDGLGPVTVRENVGNTRSGKATVGGNPVAREQSHARMFEFLSAQLGRPLLLPHEQRLRLGEPRRQPAPVN